MNDNKPPIDWADRAVGLGAGLASALLFAASARGTGLALALTYFSPLPLLIGVLGFSLPAALVGALLGAVLLAEAAHPAFGLAFLLGFALPSLIVGGLAQRNFPEMSPTSARLPRYLRPGSLLAIILLLSTLGVWFGVAATMQRFGGFEAALAALAKQFGPALGDATERLHEISSDLDAETVEKMLLMGAPAAVALSQTLLFAVNLWFAGRTVEISGRLGRPWPSIPEHLILPRAIAPLFVIAAGLSWLGGLVGMLAGAFAAAAGLCLAMQGLAVLHALSRDNAWRTPLLTTIYASVFALEPWSLLALALLGLVESALSLRARRARRLSTKTET